MESLKLIELNKIYMKYFINDDEQIRNKGIVRYAIKVEHGEVESTNGEPVENLLGVKTHFDLIVLLPDFNIKNDDKEVFTDDEVEARITIVYKVVVENKIDEIDKELLHDDLLNMVEPYLRKDVEEFCAEVKIPKLPLPYKFWRTK